MARWSDVDRIAAALPHMQRDERHAHSWRVRGKPVAWPRPLRAADRAELGERAPAGAILGVRTDGEEGKAELLAAAPDVYFTTSHFDGYPTVLVRLAAIGVAELREIITESWRVQAPKRVLAEHGDALARASGRRRPADG